MPGNNTVIFFIVIMLILANSMLNAFEFSLQE